MELVSNVAQQVGQRKGTRVSGELLALASVFPNERSWDTFADEDHFINSKWHVLFLDVVGVMSISRRAGGVRLIPGERYVRRGTLIDFRGLNLFNDIKGSTGEFKDFAFLRTEMR
eukprot:CAMPEP_0167743054 /NCGR_PEP_ID=MMETSP0110_2-20121227/1794_1 /TAXON_ID=629695 /ORGANISM="Gymnochlora sp., Strain CCMP2014" /LENGTH=114 /DNA_ID=CAMNT_0007627365 /DNA_START=483 /DNA_END=827 /DNA_ORIENTATION=-